MEQRKQIEDFDTIDLFREGRVYKTVQYSFEHGNPNLPLLREMASETEDPKKGLIIEYLKAYCLAACPGIVHDEIHPDKVIGCVCQLETA